MIGFLLLAGATIEFLLALQYGGNRFSWNSSQVIGLFVGAGVTILFWIVWNHKKGEEALLPFYIIKRKVIWANALNYSFLMATLFGSSFYLPIYFQAVKGVNAIMGGVYLLRTILPQLLLAVLSGVLDKDFLFDNASSRNLPTIFFSCLVTRVGRVPPSAIYAATLTAVGSGLFALFQPHTPTGKWVGYHILTGAGRGVSFQMVGHFT